MKEDESGDELSPLIAGMKGTAESLSQIQGHIERPSQKIPLVYDVDVVVVGAGVAAALAVKHGVEPREIDVKEFQKILHLLGSEMGPEDRLRELGII